MRPLPRQSALGYNCNSFAIAERSPLSSPIVKPALFDGWSLATRAAIILPLMPLVALAWLALLPHEPVWGHLWRNVLPGQTVTTLGLMLGVGLISATIGTLSAWLVTFYRFPLRGFLSWALLLPLAVPTYLMAYSYGDVLDQAGPLYAVWRTLFGAASYPDFRSLPGAVILLSLVLYPYVYLSARAAFVQQSSVLIEAGRSLGLSPWACFTRIGLPMARPAIIIGVALTLMECLNDIGAVEFLGVNTLTMGVYDTWLVRGSLSGAAQLALTLLMFMALLLALERSQRGKGGHYPRQNRRRSLPRFTAAPGVRFGFTLLCGLPVLLGFVAPAALLLMQIDGSQIGALWRPTAHSLGLALAASILCVGLGLLMAYGTRLGGKTDARAARLAALGYAVPGTVLAIGVMVTLGLLADISAGLIVLSGTATALVGAYVIRFLSLSFGTLEAGFGRISPHIDMAARGLGAGRNATLARVLLPLLRAPVLTAFILVFVDVMKELPATLILRPFDFETLATTVYTYASVGQLEDAALPALMIIAVGLIPVVISLRLIEKAR